MSRLRDAERELRQFRSAQLLSSAAQFASEAEDVGPVALVAKRVPDGTTADGIRELALDIRGRLAGRAASRGGARGPAQGPAGGCDRG